MKHFKFLLLISGLVSETWGQQSFNQTAIDPRASTQQRADLRSVLKSVQQPKQVAPDNKPQAQSKSDKRQLTPQERVNLREQLRQHYQEAKLERP